MDDGGFVKWMASGVVEVLDVSLGSLRFSLHVTRDPVMTNCASGANTSGCCLGNQARTTLTRQPPRHRHPKHHTQLNNTVPFPHLATPTVASFRRFAFPPYPSIIATLLSHVWNSSFIPNRLTTVPHEIPTTTGPRWGRNEKIQDGYN